MNDQKRQKKEWMLIVWFNNDVGGPQIEYEDIVESAILLKNKGCLYVCETLKELRELADLIGIHFHRNDALAGQCFLETNAGDVALIVHGNRKAIRNKVEISL